MLVLIMNMIYIEQYYNLFNVLKIRWVIELEKLLV